MHPRRGAAPHRTRVRAERRKTRLRTRVETKALLLSRKPRPSRADPLQRKDTAVKRPKPPCLRHNPASAALGKEGKERKKKDARRRLSSPGETTDARGSPRRTREKESRTGTFKIRGVGWGRPTWQQRSEDGERARIGARRSQSERRDSLKPGADWLGRGGGRREPGGEAGRRRG